MIRATTNLFVTSFATLALALTVGAAEVGQPAPGFTGTDINGKTHSLSDYKGKIVVLEAYNLDCPYCANHFKTGAMQELQKELSDKGVVWLLVNSVNPEHPSHRSPEKARAEWEQQNIQATAWIDDSSGEIGRAYGLRTTPHMIVIDQQGNLAYDGAIDDQPSAKGDPKAARNYVREAVDALLAGEPVPTAETKPYGCSVKYGS
jgi:peroxiredoxin